MILACRLTQAWLARPCVVGMAVNNRSADGNFRSATNYRAVLRRGIAMASRLSVCLVCNVDALWSNSLGYFKNNYYNLLRIVRLGSLLSTAPIALSVYIVQARGTSSNLGKVQCSNYMEARVCRAPSLVTTAPTLCGKFGVQRGPPSSPSLLQTRSHKVQFL